MALNIIKTKEALKEYVMNTLGEPIITVEVTDTQLENAIDVAVQKFSDFAMGGDTLKLYSFDLVPGVKTYVLDSRVQAVTRVRTRSNSYNFQLPGVMVLTPSDICALAISPTGSLDMGNISSVLAEISVLEHMFDVEPHYSYNGNSKVLEFYDNSDQMSYNKVLVEAYVSYSPNDVDMIFNHQWIKDYSVALTKKQWGNNIGKINAPLIGGGTLNYDRLLQEAAQEIEKLDQDLLTRWSAPLGIYRA